MNEKRQIAVIQYILSATEKCNTPGGNYYYRRGYHCNCSFVNCYIPE